MTSGREIAIEQKVVYVLSGYVPDRARLRKWYQRQRYLASSRRNHLMSRNVIFHDSSNELASSRTLLPGKILHLAKDRIGKLDH